MANCELAKKIISVMRECQRVGKNGLNSKQGYKYSKSADVVAMVNEALTKNNIATIAEVEIINRESDEEGKKNFARVKMIVTLIDADSGEERKIFGIGEGFDSLDKAFAKAQTQALKYAYISSFAIAQGDDPEKDSDEDDTYFAPTQAPVQKAENQNVCEQCGKPVKENVVKYSKSKFDKVLCYDCQKNFRN